MNKMNLNQSSESAENISEIFYLINFFSKVPSEQWNSVPDTFTPVWVETYSVQCNIHNQILFLTCMFLKNIEETLWEKHGFNQSTVEVLVNEIHPLIDCWVLGDYFYRQAHDYNSDFIFEKEEEITEPSKIWLVLKRLCQIVLNLEDWSNYEIRELSFRHFVEKHSHPYDPV
jgi:hypothetical protein